MCVTSIVALMNKNNDVSMAATNDREFWKSMFFAVMCMGFVLAFVSVMHHEENQRGTLNIDDPLQVAYNGLLVTLCAVFSIVLIVGWSAMHSDNCNCDCIAIIALLSLFPITALPITLGLGQLVAHHQAIYAHICKMLHCELLHFVLLHFVFS